MDLFPVLVEHCTQVSPAQLRTDPMCPYSLQAFMSLYVDNGVLPDGVSHFRDVVGGTSLPSLPEIQALPQYAAYREALEES